MYLIISTTFTASIQYGSNTYVKWRPMHCIINFESNVYFPKITVSMLVQRYVSIVCSNYPTLYMLNSLPSPIVKLSRLEIYNGIYFFIVVAFLAFLQNPFGDMGAFMKQVQQAQQVV